MLYSIKAKRLSVNHSEIMKVSSYNFAKSKIAQKQAKIYIFNSAKKIPMSIIKFLTAYLVLEDQILVVCNISG